MKHKRDISADEAMERLIDGTLNSQPFIGL